MKIVVTIPTYNEKGNIEQLIKELENVFQSIKHHKMSILVVDDNSPDGTGDSVKDLMKEYGNLKLLTGEK